MIPTPEEARSHLVEAGAARELLAARGRWPRAYMLVYAFGATATFILVGLAGDIGVIAAAVIWPATVVIMQRASRSRAVTQRGGRQALATVTIIWGVLYAVGLGIGFTSFRESPWYWIPVGIVIGLPFAIMASKIGRA